MARGKGNRPRTRNAQMIGAGKAPKMIRKLDGTTNFRDSVGKTSIKSAAFKKTKQLELPIPRPTKARKAITQNTPPTNRTQKRLVTKSNKKPRTPKPAKSKFSMVHQMKKAGKAITKTVSKGINKLRSYMKKNIAQKAPSKSRKVVKRPPSRGR